jgi:uncharacterized Zn-finger protein
MRCHSGERPYSCMFEGCGKSFSDRGNMKMHFKIHFKKINSSELEEDHQNELSNPEIEENPQISEVNNITKLSIEKTHLDIIAPTHSEINNLRNLNSPQEDFLISAELYLRNNRNLINDQDIVGSDTPNSYK